MKLKEVVHNRMSTVQSEGILKSTVQYRGQPEVRAY
jgi:hypothetical protein